MVPWSDKQITVTVYNPRRHEPGKATDHNSTLAMARAWLLSQGVQPAEE